jgi:hypothetical protein
MKIPCSTRIFFLLRHTGIWPDDSPMTRSICRAIPADHVLLDHLTQCDRLVVRVSGRQGGRPQWKIYNAYLASMALPEGHFILVRNAVRR